MLMELSYPERTGLIVRDITGIGSGQAHINANEMATIDGALYNSSRLTTRNIVITLRFLMEPSVEENRRKTYKYFPVKKKVTLQFYTDNGVREIVGYVEHNDPNVFSKEEESQISVLCPDPYFYDVNYTDMILSGFKSMFEFPFSNESLDENLIQFDDLHYDKRTTINYTGEADTGVLIRLKANGNVKNITLINNDTSEVMVISTSRFPSLLGDHLSETDLVEISTYVGKRSIYLIRNGLRYNIINALGRHAGWFTIVAGQNTFAYSAEEGENLLDVAFNYKNVYQGV